MKNNINKFIIICLSLLMISSCKNSGTQVSNINQEFELVELFTKDGCTMYRFIDGTEYVYWSNCTGNTSYTTDDKEHKIINSITNK